MLHTENDLSTVKHEVLVTVAKHAFLGNLEETVERIPYDMIPGPQPSFRCCIYREREIIRQRVRLARGYAPMEDQNNRNIVQTITAACEGCPITRFTVTDNCQRCMGKKCQKACNFQAITMLPNRAFIDPSKCKECGMCAQACPYNAIADLMRPCKRSCPVDAITMDENNIVVIDEGKCIQCGSCIKDCPFGAISDRSFMVDVINLIRSGKEVYAMLAPAVEGQFGPTASIGILSEAIEELGFSGTFEVALGADLTASSEADEWNEAYHEGKKKTTSCCPAFVNMVKKHFPTLIDSVSSTGSPMLLTSKVIKAMHPDAITVFIGPCIAKKSEVLDYVFTEGATDYALTFDELYAMFQAKDIDLSSFGGNEQQGSIYAKNFAVSGGVTASVLQSLKEKNQDANFNVQTCSGGAECKKALMLLRAGKLPADFIEGMSCVGGCVNGPGSILTGRMAQQNRAKLLAKADGRGVEDTVAKYKDLGIHTHVK